MTTNQELRSQVSVDYASRIAAEDEKPLQKTQTDLGYSEADLAALPDGATGSSFGCGNPVAFSYVKPGDTVLDLGSGAGLDLLVARERTGPEGRVIGVDMTEAMLEKARTNIAKSGHKNIEVRRGVIEALPIETGSVDWVISNCVVNLSPEKDRVFAEIQRVLRPGGQMLISDIVIDGVPRWARWVAGRFNPAVGRAMGQDDYLRELKRAGLEDTNVVDRQVYDREAITGMVDSELLLQRNAVLATLGKLIAKPLVSVAAGKVTSIRVYARKGA